MKPDIKLNLAANTYLERSRQYGDNYMKFGFVAHALMPGGVIISTPEDWNRIHLFIMKLVKITRYAENWSNGGHVDSIDDDLVYTAMLAEVDDLILSDQHPKAFTYSPPPPDEEIPF